MSGKGKGRGRAKRGLHTVGGDFPYSPKIATSAAGHGSPSFAAVPARRLVCSHCKKTHAFRWDKQYEVCTHCNTGRWQ